MAARSLFALIARGISMDRADRSVLVDVDITITEMSRMAVVGPNGVGKSTLLKILAGELVPAAGSVTVAPTTTTVGLLHQELQHAGAPTVRDLVALRTGVVAACLEFDRATADLAENAAGAADRYDVALQRWLSVGAADFDARLRALADDLGLLASLLEAVPSELSGGQAARVNLASVMLSRFDVTLLDEPTNDLDLDGLERLEQWVAEYSGGLVVVSHDRAFLERSVSSVLEIDEHSHTASLFDGGWQSFMVERQRVRDHAEQRHRVFVNQRDRLAARAQQQREWSDQGASHARKHPADGDKHRLAFNLAQTEKLAGKAKATLRALDRLEQVQKPWEGWDLRFTIGEARRSATVVAAFDAVVLSRGDFVLGPIDMEVRWGDRVALVGPNGCGKSTLIEALLGRLDPMSGNVTLGRGVVAGELDQRRSMFEGRAGDSLLHVFQELADLAVSEARSVLAKFGLDAEAVTRPAASLSPGERTRAQLALFQGHSVNFLVLDEPTNHLDLAAIEQLEQALESYAGTLLLVSHDRRLLETVEIGRSIDMAQFAGHT